jgi:hypothetical protein
MNGFNKQTTVSIMLLFLFSHLLSHAVFNIYEDPAFANPASGNFNISGSPCIDRGDPDSDEDGEYWTTDADDQDPDETRLDIGCYYNHHIGDLHHFTEGIHWVSFPHLNQQGLSNGILSEQVFFENDEPGLFQSYSNGPSLVNGLVEIVGYRDDLLIDVQYNENDGFEDHNFGNQLFRHEGYKVQVAEGAEESYIHADGELLSLYTIPDMPALEDFWLGYYLPYPQNIEDALGDTFAHVNRVWAEDWYYDALNNHRSLEPSVPSNSTEGKSMVYGKMYIVEMHEPVSNFSWNFSGTTEEPIPLSEPQSFTYTEKMDYEVIDVLEIPENIVEIGVFEENTCVGAVVVQDSSAQILVYSDSGNRDGSVFTFQYVTGRGCASQLAEYLVLNQQTGRFEASEIVSGRQRYSVISFANDYKPENHLPAIHLKGNYPNPFNPETTIAFSLPDNQKVTLCIYNIRGQMVRELLHGDCTRGTHTVVWDGRDHTNKQVSSGLYFYKLKTADAEISKKMVLLK